MLDTSLKQNSESVFIDLLTYQDLEMLKSRKSRRGATDTSTSSISSRVSSNKRYIILTYASEFDRCVLGSAACVERRASSC